MPNGQPVIDGELDGAVIYFASDTTGQSLSVDGSWTAIGFVLFQLSFFVKAKTEGKYLLEICCNLHK